MGTPSDKKSSSKVVPEIIAQNQTPDDPESSTLQETTEMTILRNIPSLGIFMESDLDHSGKDIFVDTGQNVNLETLDKLEKELLLTSDLVENVQEELTLPGPSGLQESNLELKKVKGEKGSLKRFYCSVCNKNFGSATKLVAHQSIHGENTPFKCEQCKKSFSSKFKLVRHVLIHSDRKPFSCTVCERTFHRKDHLKNHIKVHSPSKKVFTCEKQNCRKEYTSIMSYRKHLALHSAEEGGLECKICSKTFENKPEILYHLKIHAGSRTVKNPNEKKFTCDHCDRKFFTRKDVRRHLVVHTGTRNFLCQFCPQRFGRKDHLVRHIKKSHSTNYSESETSEITPPKIQSNQISKISDSTNVQIVSTKIEVTEIVDIQPIQSILSEENVSKVSLPPFKTNFENVVNTLQFGHDNKPRSENVPDILYPPESQRENVYMPQKNDFLTVGAVKTFSFGQESTNLDTKKSQYQQLRHNVVSDTLKSFQQKEEEKFSGEDLVSETKKIQFEASQSEDITKSKILGVEDILSRKQVFYSESTILSDTESQGFDQIGEPSQSDIKLEGVQNLDKMLDFSSEESILDDSIKHEMISVENILVTESVEKMLNYPSDSQIKLDESQKNELSVENILFPQTFSELSPMLCSETDNLQYLPHSVESCDETNRELYIKNTTNLPTETELLTELVVMKEELEQHLSGQSTSTQNVDLLTVSQDISDLNNSQLMTSDMIDSDILRLISEGSGDLSQNEDDNNLPLPGFSQAFQQPP